jgi:hypothetical protein
MATSAVVTVRSLEKNIGNQYFEKISFGGAVTTDQTKSGFILNVTSKDLQIIYPDCIIKDHQDRFFLHVYENNNKLSSEYINMDFDLNTKEGKPSYFRNSSVCIFKKEFPVKEIKEVDVGQFRTPNGICCEIIWSRYIYLDSSLKSK